MQTRNAQSTSSAFNTPSWVTQSQTGGRTTTETEAFAIEGLLQMQAQSAQEPHVPQNIAPPPPTSYVLAASEVLAQTANPPTFGSARNNILNLSDETWASVTTGKREVLGIVSWLVARFGKNSDIVQRCYRLLPYIREPPSYPAPPLGWDAAVDELGRRFYVNMATGVSEWARPKDPVSGYVAPIPFTPSGFPYRTLSNEVPTEATAQPEPPRPREADPEWRPRWPITMPETSTPRRSQRIRTMSERSSATVSAETETDTATAAAPTRRRSTRPQQPWDTPLRPSTRLASRATPLRRSTRLASHA